jgi:hypothetical protein
MHIIVFGKLRVRSRDPLFAYGDILREAGIEIQGNQIMFLDRDRTDVRN